MREISTVNIERDGAESIQWNWKKARVAEDTVYFEFRVGIHSMELKVHIELVYVYEFLGFESIQWNWKLALLVVISMVQVYVNPFNGIESSHLYSMYLAWYSLKRIHSMELKVMVSIDMLSLPISNPFNGIESPLNYCWGI